MPRKRAQRLDRKKIISGSVVALGLLVGMATCFHAKRSADEAATSNQYTAKSFQTLLRISNGHLQPTNADATISRVSFYFEPVTLYQRPPPPRTLTVKDEFDAEQFMQRVEDEASSVAVNQSIYRTINDGGSITFALEIPVVFDYDAVSKGWKQHYTQGYIYSTKFRSRTKGKIPAALARPDLNLMTVHHDTDMRGELQGGIDLADDSAIKTFFAKTHGSGVATVEAGRSGVVNVTLGPSENDELQRVMDATAARAQTDQPARAETYPKPPNR